MNSSSLREITVYRELSCNPHPNIIQLLDVFPFRQNMVMIFELGAGDLKNLLLDDKIVITPSDIKTYMKMILESVEFIHKNYIIHRDLKPENILIGQDGQLKLTDFGLGKYYGNPSTVFTPIACTINYRPPELLFGSMYYGPSCDIWSCGCIFGELLGKKPLFLAQTELDMLGQIFSVTGTPNDTNWPGAKSLPHYIEFNETTPVDLSNWFSFASKNTIDLLQGLLALDPAKRLTASEALNHPYFTEDPPPTPVNLLPSTPVANPINKTPDDSFSNNESSFDRKMTSTERVNKRFGVTPLFSPIPRKQLKFVE